MKIYDETHSILLGMHPVLLTAIAVVMALVGFLVLLAVVGRAPDPVGEPQRPRMGRFVSGVVLIAVAVAVALSVPAALVISRDAADAAAAEFYAQQVADQYDLELTESQIEGLQFPSEEPTADQEVYGTIRFLDGHDLQTVTLVWDRTQLKLLKPAAPTAQ